MSTPKTWLITGASKGFGLQIAKAALEAGDQVIASVRNNPATLTTALNNHPSLLAVVMDVTKEQTVIAAVQQGIDRFGRIDVLVNNAGYGIVTAIEEASDAEVKKQYDTNVFGLLNVTRAVLPFMRQQRAGRIINISSLFGYDALPGWALYGSTKFAVEGISKGLAVELQPFGIQVTSLAPGLFRTDFLGTDSYSSGAQIIEDYAATTVGDMRKAPDQLHGNQPGDPAKLADVVIELANETAPPLHLPVGKDSLEFYRNATVKTSKEIEQWATAFTPTEFSTTLQEA